MKSIVNSFAFQRDLFVKESAKYEAYLIKIKDYPKNLKLLIPNNFIKELKINSIVNMKILDLASGPGFAGLYLQQAMEAKNISVDSVTFVDVNSDRLKAIPKNNRYSILEDDILKFFVSSKENFDITILRYSIYYFNKKQQNDLIDSTFHNLHSPGCFILASFGISKEEVKFFTDLHTYILAMQGVKNEGLYRTPQEYINQIKKVGFQNIEVGYGLTFWNTNDLGDKFGLVEAQKDKLRKFIISHKFLKLKYTKNSVFFNFPVFTLKATKI